MRQHIHSTRRRQSASLGRAVPQGVTLIELLIVIFILLILTVVALPLLAPATEDRQIRESSRNVNAMLAGARDRAIGTGRPHGVKFERFVDPRTGAFSANQLNMTMTLSYVEVPEPYGGDFTTSRMSVIFRNGKNEIIFAGDPLSATPDTWQQRIRVGDQLRLNYQGHVYTINALAGNFDPLTGYIFNAFTMGADPSVCWLTSETNTYPLTISNASYQIIRQPVKSGTTAYQMPDPIIVDLGASGGQGNEFAATSATDNTPVIVLFGPNGGVERIYCSSAPGGSARPISPVYLLIGKSQKVNFDVYPPAPAVPNGVFDNADDLANLWVSVNSRSGLIQTANCFFDPANPNSYARSRRYAREQQGLGGR